MPTEPSFRFWGSTFSVKLLAIPFALAALVVAMRLSDSTPSDSERETFVCDTVRRWRADHGAGADLWVVRVDVNFEGRDGSFVPGEGAVVTPAGADVPGLQEVVATSGFPAPVATIEFEGVRNPVWPYPGTVHRDMRFTAITLVRLDAAPRADPPHDRRIADEMARYEALLRVREHANHGLESCKQFSPWARAVAGDGTAEQKMSSIAASLASMLDTTAIEHDSPCFALRERRLTPHLAQVLAVMTAREVGVPAFAVSAADPARRYLVAVRTAPLTWRLLDVLHADAGYVDEPLPLLSKAPLIRAFAYAQHDLWQPRAAAYGPEGAFSFTAWFDPSAAKRADTDYTRATSAPLAKVCT